MNNRLHFLFAAAVASLSLGTTQAQTVADFEEVPLPGPDTTYLHTQMGNGDGIYSFQSGHATLYGNVFYEVLWGGFNCSNYTDNVTNSYTNDAASITGAGFNGSEQYVVSFIGIDFMGPDPTRTIPNSMQLTGDAAGQQVAGIYATNTAYTYFYITDNNYYAEHELYYHLIVRGYMNGIPAADSVVFPLADFTEDNELVVSDWTWVDLSSLGQVDSLTFDVASNDTDQFGISTPAYFALDYLITLDGNCPGPDQLVASDIGAESAVISWANEISQLTTTYEIAVDESATLEPTASVTQVSGNSYSASLLTPNTLYYAHIRSTCDDGSFSDWDTLSFTTELPSAINETANEGFKVLISPNPASNYLDVQTDRQVTFAVIGLDGSRIALPVLHHRIDISSLPAGLYFLKVTDSQTARQHTLRFVKY